MAMNILLEGSVKKIEFLQMITRVKSGGHRLVRYDMLACTRAGKCLYIVEIVAHCTQHPYACTLPAISPPPASSCPPFPLIYSTSRSHLHQKFIGDMAQIEGLHILRRTTIHPVLHHVHQHGW